MWSYNKVVTRYDVPQDRQRTRRRSIGGKKVEDCSGTGLWDDQRRTESFSSSEITLCYSPLLVLRATLSRIVLYTFARDRCNHVSVARNLTEEKQRLMPLIIAFPYINGRIRPRDWTEIWQSANVGSCYRSIPT